MNQEYDIKEINQDRIVDQIRCLGIDMITEANSGHPGIVLGAAPAMYALFAHHLMFDPKNPDYFNRDRFVMSAGHGSALLYSTLYMAGYNITMDDLKGYSNMFYDFFTGPGEKYYIGKNERESYTKEEYEDKVFVDFVKYAIDYAKKHKEKNYIIEGIWIYLYFDDPSINQKFVQQKEKCKEIKKI